METSSSDLNHTVPISILVHQASCTPVHNCTAGLRQPRKSFGVLNTSTPAAKQSAKRPKTVAGLTQCQEATLCHPHNIPVPAGGSKQFPGAMPAATAAALAPHQRMELNLLRMASITAPKSSRTCAGQRTVSAAGCRVLLKFPRPGPRARARGSALSALWGPGFGAELVHCLHATQHGEQSCRNVADLAECLKQNRNQEVSKSFDETRGSGCRGGTPARAGWHAWRPCRGCRRRGRPPWTART